MFGFVGREDSSEYENFWNGICLFRQLEDQLKQEQEQLDKKAAEFAKEKQELEDKLRREEKHIEETLRAKLDRVLHEKVELENKLEQEQE